MMSKIYKRISSLAVVVGLLLSHVSFSADVLITTYGAAGDGTTLNSVAIQSAINECSKTGGGKVIVPAGNWLCGTIFLKDGVILWLEDNAVLLGSTNIADYSIVDGFTDGVGQQMGYCFVGAMDVKNVGIGGRGTINGQGKAIITANGKTKRPFLLRIVRCNKVSIKNVRLQASAAWTTHLYRSKNIKVDSVTIYSRGLANNDGIDIDCCENVAITNCDITSDDDAICFKTTSPFPCKNITVNRVRIRTACGAIKFGTESTGAFKNITVSNITIPYAALGAIKLNSVDGSVISNINISDIQADTVNIGIMIRLGARLKTFRPGDAQQPRGTIRDVTIRNVTVKRATLTGILFTGIPGHKVTGIKLDNIVINHIGGGTVENGKIVLPEIEAAYPETSMFGKVLPSYGIYLRHATDLQLNRINITTNTADDRPAFIGEDIRHVTAIDWSLPVTAAASPAMNFTSVSKLTFQSFILVNKPAILLNMVGDTCSDIFFKSVPFADSADAIRLGVGVKPNAVKITAPPAPI